MRERPILFSGPMVISILEGRKTQTRRLMEPQPPKVEAVYSKAGIDYHLSNLSNRIPTDAWRVMGPVWAVRDLTGMQDPQWRCPYGAPGDRLWVRESFWIGHDCNGEDGEIWDCGVNIAEDKDSPLLYVASPPNPERPDEPGDWFGPDEVFPDRTWVPWGHGGGLGPRFYSKRPSIHMPRWASRILLEVSDVRVQRLHEITEEDARAEGVEAFFTRFDCIGRDQRLNTAELCRDAEHRASFAVLWDEINGDRALWISNPWVWAITFKAVG